ncbi:MAG: S46 family peptidase [Planctomyces sp.]|nr:S46 family peptidase [Planctomyces sp.]
MKITRAVLLTSGIFATLLTLLQAEEGMIPVTQLSEFDLKSRGLEMSTTEVFDAGKVCLVDGICRVNGCTGSFVSPEGLILTNHHCAHKAIQSLSSAEHDYLTNGFMAASKAQELHAKGYTVRITESFSDVSEQVLSAATADMDFVARTKAMELRRKELEKQAETDNPGLRAEVAEMFSGRTYVLFLYTYLKDVRLVFAPPASIGEFGGEVDNWEWPRHTGDFSFMRAYTAPDGSAAEYSERNVPYRPRRVLKVQPDGVNESDFVMLLGYPGRTVRQRTASFLKYEQGVRLPYVVDTNAWEIKTLEEAGLEDRAVAIRLANRIKSLANVEKRSRGQLLGLGRTNVEQAKITEEMQFQAWIDSDEQRKAQAGSLLGDIDEVYTEISGAASFELPLQSLRSSCQCVSLAFQIFDAAVERQKPDLQRETAYMDRNFELTSQQMLLAVQDLHLPVDQKIYAEFTRRLAESPATPSSSIAAIPGVADNSQQAVERLFAQTQLTNPDFVRKCLSMSPEQLQGLNEPFLMLVETMYPEYMKLRETDKRRDGQLTQLYGPFLELKRQYQNSAFIPDANGTLRLTTGHIRGDSPRDGIRRVPVTTVRGVIEKTTGNEPFVTPDIVMQKAKNRDTTGFRHPQLGDVPVAILYDTDTTGGNSGSPVMNSRGELVGLNFDRTFEATINDFAWNPDYSRSIGVDIRYILWITGPVYGSNHLLNEMGVGVP